jgi:phosphatidate phosphatase PAH1
MSENYKDILSNLSTEVDQELLLQYLQGKLTDEQRHDMEKQLANTEFEADALEGLEEFKDKEQLQYMVEMLNRDLKKKTEKKKKRREKMRIKDQPWLWVSILILFLLVALCYILIRKLGGS